MSKNDSETKEAPEIEAETETNNQVETTTKRGRGRPKKSKEEPHVALPVDQIQEVLKNVVLTRKQGKEVEKTIRPRPPKSEKQIEAFKKMQEMNRLRKEEQEKQNPPKEYIKIPIKPKRTRTKKQQTPEEMPDNIEHKEPIVYPSDDETEQTETASETPAPIRKKRAQVAKHKSKTQEIEERLQKLKGNDYRPSSATASIFSKW